MTDYKQTYKKKEKTVNLDALGLEMGNKPPQALDFEEAVLGSLLIEPNCVDEVMDELNSACFYDPKHRMIFDAMKALVNEYESIDLIKVQHKLQVQGNLEAVGGVVALSLLSQKVGVAAQIEFYIKILKQKRIQRDLITVSHEILKDSYDDSINVDDLIDKAQSKIYGAIQDGVKRDILEIGSVIKEVNDEMENLENKEGYTGVPSGFPSLDNITMGWQKSDLIILAARPSVGKTAFALNVARNAAVDAKVPVAFFSLEMPAIQLVKRLISTETEIPSEKFRGGNKMSLEDWNNININIQALSKSPFYIDDTPSLPVMEFRSKVKRLVKSKGVGLVIVDYLQLMQGPSDSRGIREQEVAAISRTLKATAKEMNIPIIALSQLSRQSVQRTGGVGKPQLSDLRESGSIEQDADMVLFVHRPDYVGMSENVEDHKKTQIVIAKHRNGQIADIEMTFRKEIVKFEEVHESFAGGSFIPSAINDSDNISSFTGVGQDEFNSANRYGDDNPF